MTTPTQDQLDIKEWSFSPDDRQRRKERIQQRLQHRSTTKTNTATKSTSCFCCLKKSIKKTTQTTPSKSPIQNRKIWELEREYHYNRPSSLHYLYDAFDSTGRFNHLFFEPHNTAAIEYVLTFHSLIQSSSISSSSISSFFLSSSSISSSSLSSSSLSSLDNT